MPKTNFKTNPVSLETLLRRCADGSIQLPDFQRSWVWAEDRIMSLIASVSGAFPIGALMTLESKSDFIVFACRPIQGAPTGAKGMMPEELLLDGQQRMTSLFQACLRKEVVQTITPKNKLVKRWFYIDIQKAIQSGADRDEAIISVPEDRRIKTNFDKDVVLDLSERKHEFEKMMFPLNCVFDWDEWQDGFWDYLTEKGEIHKREIFKKFKDDVLQNFKSYQVPVIALEHDTSREAVCLVFEKVNTGGKPLDAFELLTAMYAAQGHRLREDWFGTEAKKGIQTRLSEYGRAGFQSAGVLAKVASTDLLQAISLRYTKKVRNDAAARGVKESELPAVRATRQSLLDLPLDAYLTYRDAVEDGFKKAAKFLHQQNIYRVVDLPYQTQLVPLAAIFSEIGNKAENAANMDKIARWYWCGIFGELYGAAVESRFVRDIIEVPGWLDGSEEPTTVKEGTFRADRLLTMRTRLSAAYKGINALLMRQGAKDFRTGQGYDITVFFDEDVDIHHIFPEDWCKKQHIDQKTYDAVINKTPLSYRTNRIIGGIAPSEYLAKLEAGRKDGTGNIQDAPIAAAALDGYLRSHLISPDLVRADNFISFMKERRKSLLKLIGDVTGHPAVEAVEEGEELSEEIVRDSGITIAGE